MTIYKRRRGTAIVETSKGILLVAGRSKLFILPGGGAEKDETRTEAAIRELREETGLIANYSKVLFRYIGSVHKSHSGGFFQDYHTVCLIKADGIPRPKHEIRYVEFYVPADTASELKISRNTKEIIDIFYESKNEY